MTNVEHRILYAAMRLFAERGGTQIAVSDLAREAGLSRGTIYNNRADVAGIYDAVCDMMASELTGAFNRRLSGLADPAQQLAGAVTLCLRRVHEEPHWGRFIARYAMGEPRLGDAWHRITADALRAGRASGRFDFTADQLASVTAASGGATFGAMTLVLNGHRTWRQVAADSAEMVLRAVGLSQPEARRLALAELDPLPRIDHFDAA